MKRTSILNMATLLVVCAGCSSSPQGKTSATLPISLKPPIVVTYYDLFDCMASELRIKDAAGRQLYLFNKPFLPDLFLSTNSCTDEPDMTCSVHITKGHPIQATLIACLEQFLEGEHDKAKLERVTKETDFTKLTEEERILRGTLCFVECLKGITKTADQVPENAAPTAKTATIDETVAEIVKHAAIADNAYFTEHMDPSYKGQETKLIEQIKASGMAEDYKNRLENLSETKARLNYHYLEKGCHFQIDLEKQNNSWVIQRIWFYR
jgi:formiminotetrahydrofolate cyclodeaminase